MKFQLIPLVIYITSLIYLNIYYPYKMHLALIDDGFYINTNIMLWINSISKLLLIMSIGYYFKKVKYVDINLYPTS